jgi:hypothetical protein
MKEKGLMAKLRLGSNPPDVWLDFPHHGREQDRRRM